MTLLNINLTDVLSETDPDDRVLVWAPAFREGAAGGLVGPRQKAIPLVDGVGSDEVLPGPLMVQVRCKAMSDTHPREVMVPEEGPVTLTALLDSVDAFTYAPPVIGQVALDAQRAKDAADRAEGVADAFGSLEGVVDQVQAVADSTHWQDDRLSVMGQLGPPLTGPKGDKGDSGDSSGDVLWAEIDPVLSSKADLVGGVVPTSQIPAVALTKPHQVNSLAEMLALPVEEGDVAVITSGDWKGTYMLGGGAADVAASWIRLSGPDAPVQSVNAQSGTVVLGHADVGAAPVSHTHPATSISDATTVGRNILKASDAASARAVIGAGTSSLALGTTAATAAAGNHTHTGYATTAQVNAKVTGVGITAIEVVTTMPGTPNPTTFYIVKAS